MKDDVSKDISSKLEHIALPAFGLSLNIIIPKFELKKIGNFDNCTLQLKRESILVVVLF